MQSIQELLKHYENIYVTSDLHFYHKNILKYESKRLDTVKLNKYDFILKNIDGFVDEIDKLVTEQDRIECLTRFLVCDEDVWWNSLEEKYYEVVAEQHWDFLKNLYNQTVGKNDLCFILGDFSLAHAKQTNELLEQLNGDKILVRGNHDNFLDNLHFYLT